MADSNRFEKQSNRHNSAIVRRSTMKFGMMTHFDPLKLSDGQKIDFKKQDGGRPMPGVPAVNILQVTQQEAAPVRCGCRFGCILAPPGEYD